VNALATRAFCAPALFDAGWYLARNPDVAAAGIDPWLHYLEFGAGEGRDPNPVFDTDWYVSTHAQARVGGINPLLHYWDYGAAHGCEPNALFDSAWYTARNPDARMNPLQHYLEYGAEAGRDPSPAFDSAQYLRANPDLRPGKLTALGDYLQYGQYEGRSLAPPGALVAEPLRPDRSERIAVYTAIVGDYDCLKIPTRIDPRCDYYCFTDRDISWQDVWKPREIAWRHADPARTSRHMKLNPHEYFPGYACSIWIDANLRLNCLAQALMPEDEWDVALWRNPSRDCVYAAAEACAREGKDTQASIAAQMQRYRDAGYPQHAGLTACGVLVRRHNTPEAIGFARAWWDEVCRGSRRDQLSFGFSAWRRNLRIAYLGPIGNSMYNDSRVSNFAHTQPRARW